jgi:uncharacterized protein
VFTPGFFYADASCSTYLHNQHHTMRNLIVLFLFVTAFTAVTSAQVPHEKTLLWQITGNGLPAPSFLYGTFHLICPVDLKVPQVVKQKLNATKQLYLEVDMDDPGMMMEMLKGIQMKDTSTLQQLLKEDYDTIQSVFETATGMPLQMLNKIKPMMLLSMIYPTIIGCQPVSWDATFMALAQERKMEVKGLETVTDQVNVFDSIPYQVQADMVKRTMLNLDSAKRSFFQLQKIYQQGEINKLYEMTTSNEDFDNYEAIFLKHRNHNWLPIIGKQAKLKPTFFAFGAGHLGGKDGVINLLRKSGFKVTPVFY